LVTGDEWRGEEEAMAMTGEQLRSAIQFAGMTIDEVARRAGVAKRSVLRYLSGERVARLAQQRSLAKVLGVEKWEDVVSVPSGSPVSQCRVSSVSSTRKKASSRGDSGIGFAITGVQKLHHAAPSAPADIPAMTDLPATPDPRPGDPDWTPAEELLPAETLDDDGCPADELVLCLVDGCERVAIDGYHYCTEHRDWDDLGSLDQLVKGLCDGRLQQGGVEWVKLRGMVADSGQLGERALRSLNAELLLRVVEAAGRVMDSGGLPAGLVSSLVQLSKSFREKR
jgi:transcriptional regulator with XRE-family HTH domain